MEKLASFKIKILYSEIVMKAIGPAECHTVCGRALCPFARGNWLYIPQSPIHRRQGVARAAVRIAARLSCAVLDQQFSRGTGVLLPWFLASADPSASRQYPSTQHATCTLDGLFLCVQNLSGVRRSIALH